MPTRVHASGAHAERGSATDTGRIGDQDKSDDHEAGVDDKKSGVKAGDVRQSGDRKADLDDTKSDAGQGTEDVGTSNSAPTSGAANDVSKVEPADGGAVAMAGNRSSVDSPQVTTPKVAAVDAAAADSEKTLVQQGDRPQPLTSAHREVQNVPQLSSASPAGAIDSTVLQAAAVQNPLTYTPGPNLFDQITLFSFEVLRAVRVATGIDLFAIGNSVISSQNPPFFTTFGLQARRTEYTTADDTTWDVWEFRPPNPTDKTVVAVHGGGFTTQPNFTAWLNYTNMARDTGATVIVPLYTLATTEAGRATKVIPDMADFLSSQIALHGAENVSLYGDSAGTILAIGALRQLLLAGKPVPARMVLLSLAADPTELNPDARKVNDPIFDVDKIDDAYNGHFFDGIHKQDPLVSALFFEPEILKALPPTTVYMAEREITYPDALLLHQRAVEVGAPITMIVGTGLVHDWPLLSGLPLFSQNVMARPNIYRQLGLTPDPATTL